MIEFRALGGIDLRSDDGRAVAAVLAQPKRLALLAYLALASPRDFQRRDVLVGLFWPELDQEHARGALRKAVQMLRRVLGAGVLVTRAEDELGVDRSALWCDAVAFEEALKAGRNSQALDLYSGDLLTGFFLSDAPGFEQWLEGERARLRERASQAARALASQYESEKNLTSAVVCARRAVALAPDDERTLRRLIVLLDQLGDRAGALRAHEDFARRLAEEFQTEPSAETKALIKAVREREARRPGVLTAAGFEVDRSSGGADPRPRPASDAPPQTPASISAPRELLAVRTDSTSPSVHPGTVIGGYIVIRELGRGGMATVYLAQDTRHDRPVALKVLRPELAATLGAERFLREIQVTARLDHPHILALLDSGEAEGRLYYVMPYVDGESLRQRLDREKQVPVEDAIQIAREVADALEHAHGRGVIHRDIKPENILLAGGHARVADFGIARALAAAGGEQLTETGIAIGTPAYMSPEQGAGSGELDGRSDIYSLGCVLYEMLAGHPPFGGTTAREILARQSLDPVPPLTAARDSVPAPIEDAVLRALEKTPADRFATAAQFSEALAVDAAAYRRRRRVRARLRRRVPLLGLGVVVLAAVVVAVSRTWSGRGTRVAVNPNVVAVLPFRVTSPDTLSNYLREGIVDLLNAWLTGDGVPRAVDSRTMLSAWRRAVTEEGGELSADQALALAQRLGAGQVMLGELVRTPGRATVSARLLRVPDGGVRAEATEVGNGDELDLVQRLVVRILAQAAEGTARVGAASDSLAALRAYLAGVQAQRRGEYASAVKHYERALVIDSAFALAALRLALVLTEVPCAQDRPHCLANAELRAWSLRDRLGPGDRAQVRALFHIGPNYPEAPTMADIIAAAEQAAAANPDRPEAWLKLGTWLLSWGRSAGVPVWLSRAVTALDSAIALDPTEAAMAYRLDAAIIRGEPNEIRRLAGLYFRLHSGGDYEGFFRWQVARALNDSAALSDLRARFAQFPPWTVGFMVPSSAGFGYALDDAEDAITVHFGGPHALPEWRCPRLMRLMEISILRGQVARAILLADSASRIKGCDEGTARQAILTVALVESGYDDAAREYARQFDVLADTASVADPACYAELWRVSQSDTSRTRRRVSRMRRLVQSLEPGPLRSVGRLGVCPLLLEAALEWMQVGPNSSPAIDRLESLMRRGTGFELPGSVAHLMLARWRAMQGDYAAARAVSWGPPAPIGTQFYIVVPAYRREEGRLAAALGDTAGAIRAYEQYLALRSDPDPGPKASEVDSVKAHLAQLTGNWK